MTTRTHHRVKRLRLPKRGPVVRLFLAVAASSFGCRDVPTVSDGRRAATTLQEAPSTPFAGRCDVRVTQTALSNGQVQLTGQGTCELTHLGRSAYAVDQIVDPAQGAITGTGTFTAANGDELRAAFSSPFATGTSLDAFQSTLTFTGGTGRFVGAAGTASFARGTGAGADLADTYTGIIKYNA